MKTVGTRTHDRVSQSPPLSATMGPTDRELLSRFVQQSDEAAFTLLVERHGPMVLGVCRRVLDHAQDAEDAFQATFLVLVRKAHSVGKPELLNNWLYGVAYRTALKARARAARRIIHERQAVPVAPSDPQYEADWRELRTRLDAELENMPTKYRAPLVLCYLDGWTNEEAARILGWPVGSISYRLARGRDLLRKRLSSSGHAFPPAAFAVMPFQGLGSASVPQSLAEQTVQSGMGLAAGGSLAASASPSVTALAEESLKGMVYGGGYALWVALTLITVGLAGFGVYAATADTWHPKKPLVVKPCLNPNGQNGADEPDDLAVKPAEQPRLEMPIQGRFKSIATAR